jgi:hypothetical protein
MMATIMENDKAAAALSLTGPGRVAIPTVNAPDLQQEAARQMNKAWGERGRNARSRRPWTRRDDAGSELPTGMSYFP